MTKAPRHDTRGLRTRLKTRTVGDVDRVGISSLCEWGIAEMMNLCERPGVVPCSAVARSVLMDKMPLACVDARV